ncbi:MAG: toprim domain-containing protein [Bacteroidota bacterium]
MKTTQKSWSYLKGFFNFLSHQTINQNQQSSSANILVLNSTSFFEKSREIMDRHESIRLFLDRDKGGQKCTSQALSWGKKYKDESFLYNGYNDLNVMAAANRQINEEGIKAGITRNLMPILRMARCTFVGQTVALSLRSRFGLECLK